jgi:hypothetical protein
MIGPVYTPSDARAPFRIRQPSHMVGLPAVICLTPHLYGHRSPSGSLILTKLTRSIKVWNEVSPASRYQLRSLTSSVLRQGCAGRRLIDIARFSLSAGCQVVKVSLRTSRRSTSLESSRVCSSVHVRGRR